MAIVPEIEATICEPSGKLIGMGSIFLYSMKDGKLKEK